MIYLLKQACSSLWSEKQRSLMAIVSIVFGVAALISLVSIGQMVAKEANKQFVALGTNVITLGLYDNSPRQVQLLDSQLTANLAKQLECIDLAVPFSSESAVINNQGNRAKLLGVNHNFFNLGSFELQAGRFLSQFDQGSAHVVLGANTIREMGLDHMQPAKYWVGKWLKIQNKKALVVGILAPHEPIASINLEPNDAIFSPYQFVQHFEKNALISTVLLQANSSVSLEACVQQLESHFAIYTRNLDLDISTPERLIAQMQQQTELLDVFLAIVAIITLLMGGVGIMNIMLSNVANRQMEVGLCRALGATQNDILKQFLSESILLSLIGGLIGCILGIWASQVAAEYYQWQAILSWQIVVTGMVTALLVGVGFGILPAYQASKMDPIEALKK
ncbi:ABC transporter permease [Catenovulum sp. SX2]|uniref:ABC transporter permease n=1 Tax=Catenovulum sp. SX2 TaxID=3398614 RepID=UPI003F82E979